MSEEIKSLLGDQHDLSAGRGSGWENIFKPEGNETKTSSEEQLKTIGNKALEVLISLMPHSRLKAVGDIIADIISPNNSSELPKNDSEKKSLFD